MPRKLAPAAACSFSPSALAIAAASKTALDCAVENGQHSVAALLASANRTDVEVGQLHAHALRLAVLDRGARQRPQTGVVGGRALLAEALDPDLREFLGAPPSKLALIL